MKGYSVNDYNSRINIADSRDDPYVGSALLTVCRLSKIVTRMADSKEVPEDKLSEAMKNILLYLMEVSGSSQLEIVRATGIKAPSVSLSLQKLESFGYVTRKSDLIDMRSVRVYLAEKGIEFCIGYLGALRDSETIAYKNMSEEEIEMFTTLSLKVLQNLQEE